MNSFASTKPKKPDEIEVPKKYPDIMPAQEPEPNVWPKREPEIKPESEPLTIPPTALPEITRPEFKS